MSVVDNDFSERVLPDTVPGRGVLEGAFFLLDALASFQDGAGLSELTRAAELPKATTYRLLEQLVELGAVQRRGRRYFVGRVLARLGGAWQPYPHLRQAAREPVNTLATLSAAAVVVWALHDGKARAIISSRGVHADLMPGVPLTTELPPQTAAGKVLFAALPHTQPTPRLDRRGDGVVLDQQEVMPGVCCVAVPVCNANGHTIAALSALTVSKAVPAGLAELTRRASHAIGRNMTVR